MKEYKVGERFYHDGVLLEVVKSDYNGGFITDCDKCAFDRITCGGCVERRCAIASRDDKIPIYFKQVKQQCINIVCQSCGTEWKPRKNRVNLCCCHPWPVVENKPPKTETRVKQPEALLKALIDGGWKPKVVDIDIHFVQEEIDFYNDMWQYCGEKPNYNYEWHPSWLEEVEV